MVGHACPGPLVKRGRGSGRYVTSNRVISVCGGGPELAARCFPALNLLERRVAVLRDDDVLKHCYPEQSARLL
jgi:hypothetical protein